MNSFFGHDGSIFSSTVTLSIYIPFYVRQARRGISSAARENQNRAAAALMMPNAVYVDNLVQGNLFVDTITIVGIVVLVVLIALLAQYEIKKSKAHAQNIERKLTGERDILEKKISLRAQQLQASEQARWVEIERIAQFGKLSHGLFHDLMNPLSAVSLSIERLANRSIQTDEAKAIVEIAVSASQRLKSFMESVRRSLASISHITEIGSVDIAKELSIVCDILSYKARMANVAIIIDSPSSVSVQSHPVRIHQTFLNIISNGIDACIERIRIYAPQIPMQVRVSIKENTICISDTGIGMKKEHSEKVFKQPFTTKSDGTGIGLITVKSIIEDELKGSIAVTSIYGTGTSFVITLPTLLCRGPGSNW